MLSPRDLHVIVGHDRMDEDHDRLAQLILALQDAVTGSAGREAVARAACDLVEFTRSHFQAEERLMDAAGYGDAEAHREDHGVLIHRLTLQLVALTLKGEQPSQGDLDVFRDWFVVHVERFDAPLAEFLRTAEPVRVTGRAAR